MAFAIKAAIADAHVATFVFAGQKTMYGGKHVAAGDAIFVFASESAGGPGLVARGIVAAAEAVALRPGVARQTPRVTLSVMRAGLAQRPFGRSEVRGFTEWRDGRPETEINFKLYRQATDKVIGITEATAAFLDGFF